MNINENQVEKEFSDLKNKFKELFIERQPPQYLISGHFKFSSEYQSVAIKDDFELDVLVPEEYPNTFPLVTEIGGKIPKEFHRNSDNTLCLGAPIRLKMQFSKQPTLTGFFENCITPYLFSFCYYQKVGKMPFGELSHEGKGILECYQEIFKITDMMPIIKFLKILADNNYRGHHDCPCGSMKNLRNCHGKILLDLNKFQTPQDFEYEYDQVIVHAVGMNVKIPKSGISKNLKKYIKNIKEKKDEKNIRSK